MLNLDLLNNKKATFEITYAENKALVKESTHRLEQVVIFPPQIQIFTAAWEGGLKQTHPLFNWTVFYKANESKHVYGCAKEICWKDSRDSGKTPTQREVPQQ